MSAILSVRDLRVRYPLASGISSLTKKEQPSFVDVVHGVSRRVNRHESGLTEIERCSCVVGVGGRSALESHGSLDERFVGLLQVGRREPLCHGVHLAEAL